MTAARLVTTEAHRPRKLSRSIDPLTQPAAAALLLGQHAERVGVPQQTFVDFRKSAEIYKTLGWKVDPDTEFTDIDPPLESVSQGAW